MVRQRPMSDRNRSSASAHRVSAHLPRSLATLATGLAVAVVVACGAPAEGDLDAQGSASSDCGTENKACCQTGRRCAGDLGCSAGVCKGILGDMVAYTEYCKEELGFRDPRAKLAFMSCFDAEAADGSRRTTGRQALLRLSVREGESVEVLSLAQNHPASPDGRDVWDRMFGNGVSPAEGCDNPNYLQSRCDPYYRLNVFSPDPGNTDVVAALHCRSDGQKPKPATAITAEARRRAYVEAPESTPLAERIRLFDQYNGTNEIVLTMTNLKTGKACFFHAKSPYYGSHIPAPDDETNLAAPGAADAVWDELPVKPAYGKTDATRRSEWLRNGANAWQRPDYMRCVGCHDSGPFMHDPFIDSMNDPSGADYLPRDKANRPYIPLGYNGQSPKTFIKTGPVRDAWGELVPQKCTSCHAMGTERQCDSWFDRAVGWSFAYTQSSESQRSEELKRYMPYEHGMTSSQEFYAENGPHIDAMKCCCEHPSWRGCKTVPAATPQAPGTEGTDARSCTESTCGAHDQECCGGTSCNHSGLRCVSGKCRFRGEVEGFDPDVRSDPMPSGG